MQTFSAQRSYRPLLILLTLIIVVLGAVAAGSAVIALFPRNLGEQYGAVLSTVREIRQALVAKAAVTYAVMAVFLIVCVVILHLFYSHRIAGPAYRLGREAAAIGQGNLKGNIRFRRKDNLTDMAESVNQVASQYKARIAAAREHLSIVEAQTEKVQKLLGHGGGAELERALEDINANVKNLDRIFEEIRA